jgi:hypothetical protein
MVSEILGSENWFLILLGLIWIIGAVLQDFRRREVDNLWNFSLIGIALAYRLAISIFSGNHWFILNGLIGLAIFYFLHNLFYYGRLFAGGDAKLLLSLGVILPLSFDWIVNLKIFGYFILLFLIAGSIYVLIWVIVLVFINRERFSKKFLEQWKNYKKMFFIAMFFSLLWIIFVFFMSQNSLILIGLIVLLFPVLFIFTKAAEESCFIKMVKPNKVTEGDWLGEDIVVAGKKIKSNWNGVSKRELSLIQSKYKQKVLVKFGVPFTPSFLISFILLLLLAWKFSWLF